MKDVAFVAHAIMDTVQSVVLMRPDKALHRTLGNVAKINSNFVCPAWQASSCSWRAPVS